MSFRRGFDDSGFAKTIPESRPQSRNAAPLEETT
jgi:hypothetical protein